ncbi:TonB-dependent receptor [Altererythrobacter fulvus]|uniref:TonB-dependent receptor n=1 Tax=Caenibius fulvus TaxID=2126012 RepID=UPI0030170DD2
MISRAVSRAGLLAGAAAGALAALPAHAETADLPAAASTAADSVEQDGGYPENVIIITARRREEAAQDVPLAIATLDGRTINETGAFNIQKLQQLAPTLQVYSSNPRNTSVNIRGIGVPFGLTNDGFEQGVGIYVDDVYYSRPASAVFDFLDVAQVEVLRGPQGTLYGKNTTAGAINIRTNQPTFDFEGNAEVTLGDLNLKQAKVAVSGPLSENIAARIAVSSTSRRGTIYNVTSGDWINSQDNLGVRGQLLFRPTDSLDITLSGDFSSQDPDCCGTVYVGYGPTQRATGRQFPALAQALGYAPASTNPFDRVTDIDASLNAGNKTGGASLRLNWDIDDKNSFTSITGWRFWDWKPENDRDYTGLAIVSKSQNPSQQNQYSQEFRFNHSGDSVNVVLGAFAFHQRIDTQGTEQQGADASYWNLKGGQYDALATDPTVLDGLTAYNTQWLKATSLALFGQLDWKVTDRLTVQPGLRLNYDKKEGHYEREVYDGDGVLLPASGGTTKQRAQRSIYSPLFYEPSFSDWNFSYDLTLSYKLADDVLAYATYAKTFKTGGINQNGVPVDANNNPIEAAYTIKPESVNHWEAGIKSQFWDRKITLNLAAFRTSIDDFQANVSNGQFGVLRGYLANAEKVRTQGVELDFNVRPSERFNAYFNGAYTDAKYVKFTDAPCPPELAGAGSGGAPYNTTPGVPGGNSQPNCDVSGQVLPGVSKWAFSYGAEANLPAKLLGNEGEVYVGVDGSYRSEFSSNPSPSIYTWIDGYALTNFRLGFRTDNGFNIYGWVRNAFDVNYFEQLNFGPSNTGLIAGNLGDPRTWGGTIRVEF